MVSPSTESATPGAIVVTKPSAGVARVPTVDVPSLVAELVQCVIALAAVLSGAFSALR